MTNSVPGVTDVDILDAYVVRLHFKDGVVGEVDLAYLLDYGPVFRPLNDAAYFRSVRVDTTIGTIVWPNGADVAPETLYELAQQREPQRTT